MREGGTVPGKYLLPGAKLSEQYRERTVSGGLVGGEVGGGQLHPLAQHLDSLAPCYHKCTIMHGTSYMQ